MLGLHQISLHSSFSKPGIRQQPAPRFILHWFASLVLQLLIAYLNTAWKLMNFAIDHTLSIVCKCLFSLAHSKNELMQWRGIRHLSVCLSVNFCANHFFSQTIGRITTKLAHDGLRVSMHPGYAQG